MKNSQAPKKILVIQTAFIGDVVLTTPMLFAIKKCFPNSYLCILVKPEAKGILEHLPFVDEVLVIDKKRKHRFLGMLSIIYLIRKKKFDVLLAPHQSLRTGIISFFSGIPYRVGYKTSALPFVYHKKLIRTKKHEIHRLIDFVKESLCSDLNYLTNAPILEETEKSKKEAKKLLENFHTKPIAFACSSVWATKRWTPWGFAELAGILIEKYRAPVILIGSKEDYELSEYIKNYAKHIYPEKYYKQIYNFCGKTDLITLFSLLKNCRLLVSNDSAPIHFACAAKIPVVTILGPTTKDLGYAPISENTAVVEIENLYCRPCGTHGNQKCPEKHFRCMKEITPLMVLNKINQLRIP
ncbi:MAG: lipopolysaccharide heptosyltransferase II [Leptonema sp. (in: bacteria)]